MTIGRLIPEQGGSPEFEGFAGPVWAPGENGPEQPNTSRIRDYWLGGHWNTALDRMIADQIVVGAPHLPYVVTTYRMFLMRAVRYLVHAGVRQFLDLGSGLPTAGNVHEIATHLDPTCHVVYVDVDPVVVAEGRSLLAGYDNAAYACADFRNPDEVLDSPERRQLLDLTQPIAVFFVDVLHFVPDGDNPHGFVSEYLDTAAPDSYLCVAHTGRDDLLRYGLDIFQRLYRTPVPPMTWRSPGELASWFSDFDLVTPGVVPATLWRPEYEEGPDLNPEHFAGYAALGSKH